jgi:hypothetical protein
MGIMGWSSMAMAARYQHVTDPIRRTVAAQVGGLLWAEERASRCRHSECKLRPKLRPRNPGRDPLSDPYSIVPGRRAEDAGFEPARACTQPAFQVRGSASGADSMHVRSEAEAVPGHWGTVANGGD